MEQFAAQRQQCCPARIGEEAEVANAHETAGQHMEEKAPNKFLGGNGHFSLTVTVSIISPEESNVPTIEAEKPMVGDRHSMGVPSKIAKHLPGSAERRFGVDDPVGPKQRTQERCEAFGVGQRLQASAEMQLAAAKGPGRS